MCKGHSSLDGEGEKGREREREASERNHIPLLFVLRGGGQLDWARPLLSFSFLGLTVTAER
jgi:hypothetical protein